MMTWLIVRVLVSTPSLLLRRYSRKALVFLPSTEFQLQYSLRGISQLGPQQFGISSAMRTQLQAVKERRVIRSMGTSPFLSKEKGFFFERQIGKGRVFPSPVYCPQRMFQSGLLFHRLVFG